MTFLCIVTIYILLISIFIYRRHLIFQYNRHSRRDRMFLFWTMGGLLLLNCLRGMNVGNDTSSYYSMFNYYIGKSTFGFSSEAIGWMTDRIEIGFQVINRIFGLFSTNYQLFISAISIFVYITVAKTIYRYSCNLGISVLLVFLMNYPIFFNVLRQSIAIAIVMMALGDIEKDNKIGFALKIALATAFHATALIALLFWPLSKVCITRKRVYAMLIGAIVFSQTGIIRNIFTQMGTSYVSWESGLNIVLTIGRDIAIVLMIVFLNPLRKQRCNQIKCSDMVVASNADGLMNMYRWMPFLCLSVSIISIASPILIRIGYYFSSIYVVAIPNIVANSKSSINNKKIIVTLLLLTLFVFIAGKIIYRPDWVTEFQYAFFWST